MGPDRGADLSVIELEPHDLALELFQADLFVPAEPVFLPRYKFGRLLAQVGVEVVLLSCGRASQRTGQQHAGPSNIEKSPSHNLLPRRDMSLYEPNGEKFIRLSLVN